MTPQLALGQIGIAVVGFLLGSALIGLTTEPEPKPIIVVCTWTQGCQQTDRPKT